MSEDPKSVHRAPESGAPRPCAFYQAAMSPSPHLPRSIAEYQAQPGPGCLAHRCMLNPGRALGPDGEDIGPLVCTPARQGGCQQHRRRNIARLNETLPSVRSAPTAQSALEAV